MLRNPDHVTIAVADAKTAVEFFELLGFRTQHVATIDGGEPAQYMGMPDMKAQHITLALEGSEPYFEIQLLEFDQFCLCCLVYIILNIVMILYILILLKTSSYLVVSSQSILDMNTITTNAYREELIIYMLAWNNSCSFSCIMFC